ncbi:MAG: hypothetical protein ACP5OK_06930 [Thermoprotei archaeon]
MRKMYSRIKEAIKNYNKYRAPESKAKILKIENNRLIVKFTGSFCETCGINSWIEDLKYEIENFDVNIELEKIIEPKKESEFRIAIFKIKL